MQGLVVFGVAWAITAASLALLHAMLPAASAPTELLVLTCANLLGTVVRFVMLRVWVFRSRSVPAVEQSAPRVVMSREKVLGA